MQFKNTSHRYGAVAQVLHWAMAIIVIGLLALGLYMDGLEPTPEKFALYGLHKSFGITVLALAFIRIGWFFYNQRPAPEASLSKLDVLASKAGHAFLYLLMLAMPVSGWIMSSAGEHPVSFFGLFTLPAIVAPDKTLGGIANAAHGWIGTAFIVIITLHAGAALTHHFILKNGVLKRMLPFIK